MPNYSDLNITPEPNIDKNFFNFKATNLKIDKTYAIKFQWVYPDGSVSPWSSGYFVNTSTESVPGAPSSTVEGGAGFIKVSLATFPTNALRVDVRISGGIFGDGTKVADSFTAAGTKTIAAPGGAAPGFAYTVTLLTVTPSKINGDPSSPVTVYVTDPTANLQAEPPTLASGLTVNSAPFAVSVNWAGTYSSADFDGFKSIDIHVRGSDVGPTSTSGFSTTTQVATLTVTGTTNRQNIGLDNLRQALGLADNTAAYTAPMFFYYITRNSQDALYSVSGTPTYTRINSASVNPTQANFVDLVNGVISIENLVAGNGNFASYLRIGSKETSGGARIELSGVNNFTDSNTTRIVQRGLTAYDSGNNEVLRFDYGATTPTLTIKGDGEFSGNLAIGSGNNIFKAQPATGVWLGHANYLDAPFKVNTTGYLESTSGKIGGWSITPTILESATVSNNKITLNPATPKIALVQSGTEKITIDPVEGIVGPNITYNSQQVPSFKLTPNGNLTIYGSVNITGGQAQTDINNATSTANAASSTATSASSTATNALNAANSKIKSYYQNDAPTGGAYVDGDLWFDLNDQNKAYRWNGSSWVSVQDTKITNALQKGGGHFIENASNQLTQINSNGITISSTGFTINTDTTATVGPSRLVMNSAGITARDGSGNNTFTINALTGDAEFKGSIKSGSTITGSEVTTLNDGSTYGYLKLNSQGSVLQLLGNDNTVYGELYQFNNGNEIILRHGNTRLSNGYPTSSAVLSLNPYSTSLGYKNSSGNLNNGLVLDGTAGGSSYQSATFYEMSVSAIGTNSSGGPGSIGGTRNFRNTVINNVTPSGSGYSIGDIWIQY